MPGVTRLTTEPARSGNRNGPCPKLTKLSSLDASPEARASVDDRRRLLFNLDRATHMPHRAGTSGNQRSTTVNSSFRRS
jgi:hypothetical protein